MIASVGSSQCVHANHFDCIKACRHNAGQNSLNAFSLFRLQCELSLTASKGLGVGVPGNQHDNTYAQGEIQRQIVCVCAILFSFKILHLTFRIIENKQFKCYCVLRLVNGNGAGSTLHVPLFSLQAAKSYGKRVLSRGHGAKGPDSIQNYPSHLNIHA